MESEPEADDDSTLSNMASELMSRGMSEEEAWDYLGRKMPELMDKSGAILLEALKDEAPEMLKDRLATRTRFRRRLQKEWGEPFRLLRMLAEMVREVGREFNAKHRPSAAADNDLVFEALLRLHQRACLLVEEVFCLLEGGFASGAHSRWRTLHEVTIVSYFIEESGQDVAERYLLHHVVETCKSAEIFQQHCESLGQEPLTDDELQQHRDARESLCNRFGKAYRLDWGWAADALNDPNPSFTSIERAVKLEHLRPYFRLACHPNHAGSIALRNDLGSSLNPDDSMMVMSSASNAGLAEAGIGTALSLYQVTVNLLNHYEIDSLRTLTELGAMKLLSDEVHEAFAMVDERLAIKAPIIRERLSRFEALNEKKPEADKP
ncbi:DUF5677 domain-containing protein [Planctomyces sp. SH-PL62]|uniref:DUF5677 domain-containing protein n=1 Tax=Planctomyces sp. SH-PL62 TaxID=1636152 RepID=UPI00078CB5A3|nr:DUF5677 domain-containing protein [Planctomyces sp. SH-PL62]AMV40980.1 hypothetical protein VT85_26330 [Planctomyces sp. SH-PL62]